MLSLSSLACWCRLRAIFRIAVPRHSVPRRRCGRSRARLPRGQAMERSRELVRRPKGRRLVLIAALGLLLAVSKLCLFTVDSSEYAIVTDFGKPTQVITEPGLRVKFPYQSVRTFDRRLFVYAAPPS